VTTHAVTVVQPDVRRRGQLYVGLAALAWSTAGLLQRELSVDVPTQLAGRALFAFLALAALAALSNRARTLEAFRSMGLAGLAVAVCTAVASGSFIVALNHANVANVLFMQALAPIAAAILAWVALGEAVTAAKPAKQARPVALSFSERHDLNRGQCSPPTRAAGAERTHRCDSRRHAAATHLDLRAAVSPQAVIHRAWRRLQALQPVPAW
jgi:uncharacterized membrane protein